jgi:hypothetical protein
MDDPTSFCLGTIVIIGIALFINASRRGARLRSAEEAYQKALHDLRRAPHSSKQREATLLAGREYARVARENKRETIFDEIALMNDINAIAGQQVSAQPTGRKEQTEPQLSYEERLERLQRLAAAGHLTKDEYVEKRRRLLDEL